MSSTQISFSIANVLLGIILNITLSNPLLAQESHCDPNLKLRQPQSDPLGYRPRGDRCEGVYAKEVSGTTLVVSFTEFVENFDPAAAQKLLVEWTTLGAGKINLRALSLKHNLYYQMDTVRPEGSSSYTWPTDVLAALNLKKNDLGIIAWALYEVGGTKRAVYFPVRLKQQSAPAKSAAYQLVLLPDAELAQVYFRLAPVKEDGTLGAFIKDEVLDGFYPAGRGVEMDIPESITPGIYYMKISATLKAGGSTKPVEMWFYKHKS